MNSKQYPAALLLMLCAAAVSAQTTTSGKTNQNSQGQGEQQQRRGPPPEAIAACSGKTAGTKCSFKNRENQSMSGTCQAGPARPGNMAAPSSGQAQPPLACRPANAPQDGKQQSSANSATGQKR